MTNEKRLFSHFKMNTDSQRLNEWSVYALFKKKKKSRKKCVDKFGKRFERNKKVDERKKTVCGNFADANKQTQLNWTEGERKKSLFQRPEIRFTKHISSE